MPFDEAFTQQDGFMHAGVVTAIVDERAASRRTR